MLELLKKHIELNHSARGIIIDGYPRTMQQLEQYETHVSFRQFLFYKLLFNHRFGLQVVDGENVDSSTIFCLFTCIMLKS